MSLLIVYPYFSTLLLSMRGEFYVVQNIFIYWLLRKYFTDMKGT